MDYHASLGVTRTATPEEIKKAYRKLAGIHHPDKGGDTKRFQEIQYAYDMLTAKGTDRFNQNYTSASNPFADLMKKYNENVKQKNYTMTVFVTLEQVANGAMENIKIDLNGVQTLVQIRIPKGVADDEQYKFRDILPDGELLITFKIHRHSLFDRKGLDLYRRVTLNMFELIVGTTVTLTDITGAEFTLTIPPNTKPDTKFRLKNRGLTKINEIGDQYVLIDIVLPDRISTQLLEMIKVELTNNPKGTYAC
jgi:curved DNA-binding protein